MKSKPGEKSLGTPKPRLVLLFADFGPFVRYVKMAQISRIVSPSVVGILLTCTN